MAGKRAEYRYAKALFALAKEQNVLQQVDADMRLIDNTIEGSKELEVVLKSPVIKDDQKLSSLKAIFKDVQKMTTNLFDLLIQNRRVELLPGVSKAFIQMVDDMNKVTTAKVTTAVPLTPEMEAKIRNKVKEITGDEASLVQHVDESIIGGFILRIGDLQYDASISGRLNNLKNKFRQGAI